MVLIMLGAPGTGKGTVANILKDELNLPTNLFFCISYTAIVLGIIWIISKVKFFHWLLNPISSTIKKFKS